VRKIVFNDLVLVRRPFDSTKDEGRPTTDDGAHLSSSVVGRPSSSVVLAGDRS
jgi:hypothetical protein